MIDFPKLDPSMSREERRKLVWAWMRKFPDPAPCLTCGRIMLAGICCDKPRFEGHDYDDNGVHHADCSKCHPRDPSLPSRR